MTATETGCLTLRALHRVQDGFRHGDPHRDRLRLLELETYILKRLDRTGRNP